MRPTSIERKVRFNIALIYLIAAITGAVMLTYLYQAQQHIKQQHTEIQRQRDTRTITQRLIRAVHESQTHYTQYIATHNPQQLQEFDLYLNVIDRIIDTLHHIPHQTIPLKPIETIRELLDQQSQASRELKQLFDAHNPLKELQEELAKQPLGEQIDTMYVHTITQKKVVKPSPKKGFFKRFAEAFAPSKDSITETINKQQDTLIVASTANTADIKRMGQATRQAQANYNERIRSLEHSMTQLLTYNQTISTQITTLLFNLQEESLTSIHAAIERSEAQIKQGYQHSVIGSIAAFVLILILIAYLLHNINQAKQARTQLEKANLQIRQIMESRHKLLLSVSHDIKSPLTSILSYLECLKTNHPKEMKSMRNSSNYIVTLIENLLEYSALEQGALNVTKTQFSPATLLEDVTEMFSPIAEQKGLCMAVDIEIDRNLIITSDAIKIKQIAANLISNALKYTREGGVGCVARYNNGWLSIEVTDTGVGIAQHLLKELFKPFSRIARNNPMAHGSGLGLYVVKGLVDLLDGKLIIESEEGKGSQFTLKLPVEESKINIVKRRQTIAVIDDDLTVAELLAHTLRSLGHNAHIASPEQTYTGYDLIITDLEMGEYTGLDVLKKTTNTPVILMTGRSDFTHEQALKLGFSNYLPKPFNRETIRTIVGDGNIPTDNLIDNDPEFERQIKTIFKEETLKNCKTLEKTLSTNDYQTAKATCHKMIPACAELGYHSIAQLLRKIDQKESSQINDEWKIELRQIIQLCQQIQNEK